MSATSWYVPSGNVRRIVMGSMPLSSSLRAIFIGLERAEGSTRIGAPMAI